MASKNKSNKCYVCLGFVLLLCLYISLAAAVLHSVVNGLFHRPYIKKTEAHDQQARAVIGQSVSVTKPVLESFITKDRDY